MFNLITAEIYIPDGLAEEEAFARTTHLCLAAHQDDIEFMAPTPILECYQKSDKWFTGVVVSDGRGSPRDGLYKNFSDEEMRLVRVKEQRKAAFIGEYAAQIMLDYPSNIIKDSSNQEPITDLVKILDATHPQMVYTHNLADKHDTHVAVALRVITAIRQLPIEKRPEKLYGCEVWRDLDWMVDSDKIGFDTSQRENLQIALMGVFDSQITGGKRYDLATMGRRKANATYLKSHGVDSSQGITYSMDLTPLMIDTNLDPAKYTNAYIQRFAEDVARRFVRVG